MLERLKFWRKDPDNQITSAVSAGDTRYVTLNGKVFRDDGKGTLAELRIEENTDGDGKAEFLGEGTAEEFRAQEEADRGFTNKPFGL